MKTVFSGIQPSGELHLGNYLGAIRNWVSLQEEYFCYFCVVDYHAITQDYEPIQMQARVLEMATDILACGVDPERSVLFVQSDVPEHTELCWVLNSVAQFGDLSRMTQFKDKSQRQEHNINVGLFDYPESARYPAFNINMRVNFASGDGGGSAFRFIGPDGVLTIDNRVTLQRAAKEREPGHTANTFSREIQQEVVRRYREQYPDAVKNAGFVWLENQTTNYQVGIYIKGTTQDLGYLRMRRWLRSRRRTGSR